MDIPLNPPPRRPLGQTGFEITPIGFGAFKIGRNQGIKYEHHYDLPSDQQTATLLNSLLDLGINHIDTAPAYGISEQRIGQHLAHRRDEFFLSTKAGETFENGTSTYDFSPRAITESVHRSLKRLRTDRLDLVLIHADRTELDIIHHSGAPEALDKLKHQGDILNAGLSGRTAEGFQAALDWADVFMVEYHPDNTELADLIATAHQRGTGILIKKGLASGKLDPHDAIRFVLDHPGVDSLTLGSLNLDHLRDNLNAASIARTDKPGRA